MPGYLPYQGDGWLHPDTSRLGWGAQPASRYVGPPIIQPPPTVHVQPVGVSPQASDVPAQPLPTGEEEVPDPESTPESSDEGNWGTLIAKLTIWVALCCGVLVVAAAALIVGVVTGLGHATRWLGLGSQTASSGLVDGANRHLVSAAKAVNTAGVKIESVGRFAARAWGMMPVLGRAFAGLTKAMSDIDEL